MDKQQLGAVHSGQAWAHLSKTKLKRKDRVWVIFQDQLISESENKKLSQKIHPIKR